MRSAFVRRLSVVALVVAACAATVPAQATPPKPATHIAITATPLATYVNQPVTISGTVTPLGKVITAVGIEYLTGSTWSAPVTLITNSAGHFSFAHKSAHAGTTTIRVVRGASTGWQAGTSNLVHVHVLAHGFAVTATPSATLLPDGATLNVAGFVTVLPHVLTASPPPAGSAKGPVTLQRLDGATWTTVAKAVAVTGKRYLLTAKVHEGDDLYRVRRAPAAEVAGAVSHTFTVNVDPPQVTTAALPTGTVGIGYDAALAADGGQAPYTWSTSSLPAGLVLQGAAIVGTPTTAGTTVVDVTATDAHGLSSVRTLSLAVIGVHGLAWGANAVGQLGDGLTTPSATPTAVLIPSSTTSVVGGTSFALALQADGTVWAWGGNADGELGNGTTTDSATPVQVAGLTHVVDVAAGYTSGYAVKSDGTVWSWGANSNGELGVGNQTSSAVPVQVPGLSDVNQVSAGNEFALALHSDGTVSAWGNAYAGETGIGARYPMQTTPVTVELIGGSSATRAVAIATASNTGYAVLADGTVRAWGLANDAALGNDSSSSEAPPATTPVEVLADPSSTELLVPLTGVSSLACGGTSCFALLGDGSVMDWGRGIEGQLGRQPGEDSFVAGPVPGLAAVSQLAAHHHTAYALLSNGTVDAWGDNTGGQLGNGSTATGPAIAQVPGLTGVVGLGAGYQTGYALVRS